jgi:pimeloyl-ACP methyl ester carboxylesterase
MNTEAHQPPPLHLFGGQGRLLHLAHANGFPPGTYRRLALALTARYRVAGLPLRPLWPGSSPASALTWRPLASDLVAALEREGESGIVGVGHSLGGVLTLWAAIDRPDLFRAVVLIDPVILPRRWLWSMRLLRAAGLGHRQPLVQGALRRRTRWPSRAACLDHLRRKPLFAAWTDGALEDYVDSATRPMADGSVELIYPPAWEAHIFATTPTDTWRDAPKLRIPTLLIRGERSTTFLGPVAARLAQMLPQAQRVTIAGAGHLAPMERPAETAAALLDFLERCPS